MFIVCENGMSAYSFNLRQRVANPFLNDFVLHVTELSEASPAPVSGLLVAGAGLGCLQRAAMPRKVHSSRVKPIRRLGHVPLKLVTA